MESTAPQNRAEATNLKTANRHSRLAVYDPTLLSTTRAQGELVVGDDGRGLVCPKGARYQCSLLPGVCWGRGNLPVHEVVSKIQVLLQRLHGPVLLEVATPKGRQMLEG